MLHRTKLIVIAVVVLVLCLAVAGPALADNPNPGNPGQPGQTCQLLGTPPPSPGNSANNTGSPFAPGGQAGTVYAGTQPQNSNNPNSVSQYDVACFQQSQHH